MKLLQLQKSDYGKSCKKNRLKKIFSNKKE